MPLHMFRLNIIDWTNYQMLKYRIFRSFSSAGREDDAKKHQFLVTLKANCVTSQGGVCNTSLRHSLPSPSLPPKKTPLL